jgi:hypothetical protein
MVNAINCLQKGAFISSGNNDLCHFSDNDISGSSINNTIGLSERYTDANIDKICFSPDDKLSIFIGISFSSLTNRILNSRFSLSSFTLFLSPELLKNKFTELIKSNNLFSIILTSVSNLEILENNTDNCLSDPSKTFEMFLLS